MKSKQSIYLLLLLPVLILNFGFYYSAKDYNHPEGNNFNCPIGSVNLATQAEVDDWVAQWGGCTKIEGSLVIGKNSGVGNSCDISDISGLMGLEEVTGVIIIQKNANLIDLTGLNNLHTAGGSFVRIAHNYDLQNLDGLQNLSSATVLEIYENYNLVSLTGLEGLTSVSDEFLIERNSKLENIQALSNLTDVHTLSILYAGRLKNLIGLEGLTSIEGLSIKNNDSLSTLQGLNNLETAGAIAFGSISATSDDGNPILEDLTGLDNLHYADGISFYNSQLTSLTGLESLDSVTTIGFTKNSVLESLNGLNNLKKVGFNFLMKDNHTLTDLSALSNLKEVGSSFHITRSDALEDLTGLGGLEEVLYFWINDNENLTNLNGLNGSTSITGRFNIFDNNSLTSLSGFTNYNSIEILSIFDNELLSDISQLSELTEAGGIYIGNNDALESLTGLENLTALDQYLYIENNQTLNDLNELQNLATIGTSLTISNNDSLKNLVGLNKITHIPEELKICENKSLINLNGLHLLETVGGDFNLNENDALKNLKLLRNLNHVGGSLSIQNNPSMNDIRGLNKLNFVGGHITINNNDVLHKINGFRNLETIGQSFRILNNDVIQNIDGMDQLTTIENSIAVTGNPLLATCHVNYICRHLLANKPISINNNMEGCNNPTDSFTDYCGFSTFTGSIIRDEEDFCLPNLGEPTLEGWKIKATSAEYEKITFSDHNGNYILNVDTGEFSLSLISPNELWNTCSNNQAYLIDSSYDTIQLDLIAQALIDCPLMNVGINSTPIRRCTETNYVIDYCNEGTIDATDAFVTIYLHPFLNITNSSLPFTNDGDNILIFELGDVAYGDCGSFTFEAFVDCDAVTGQTLCITANIFPDTICTNPSQSWSKADIFVKGECNPTEVNFSIENKGTGNMTLPSSYRVFRDAVPFEEGSFQLLANEVFNLYFPKDGYTYRLETDQVSEHPLITSPGVTVEGCKDGNEFFSTGYFLQFPTEDYAHAFERFCKEITGSYDPNDKRGFPLGCGDEHFIEANSRLDYNIRFQNTGNDTAFLVVILDTLPENLNATSIELGASSHPYHMEVFNGNIIQFTFENIMLPDSNINQLASNGFVSFSIRQNPDLPAGSEFLNSAAIYFDFNEAIITNATHHKIGTHTFFTNEYVILCEGENYEGVVYTQNTTLGDTTSFGVVETVHNINIEIIPSLQTSIDTIIPLGDLYNDILYVVDTTLIENYIDQFGCDSIVSVNILVNPLKNNFVAFDHATVLITPNPFSTKATIQIKNLAVRFGVFEVYDLMGKKVLETNFYNHEFEITKRDLTSGIYFYKLTIENKYVNEGKFIIH